MGSVLTRANRFPAILKGEDQAASNAERLVFAHMAYDRKHLAGIRDAAALAKLPAEEQQESQDPARRARADPRDRLVAAAVGSTQ
jgi:hypothetical protein